MVKQIRQLIKKGDPKLHVFIPKAIKTSIADAAKLCKRQPQDEVIKRLAATIKNEEAYNMLKALIAKQIKLAIK